MRGLLSSAQSLSLNIRSAITDHFDLFHDGRKPVALFLRIPFTRLTAFLELAPVPVGFGHERGSGQWEFFAGRVQGVLCIERTAARRAP